MAPEKPPFDCHVRLPGWRLHIAQLEIAEGRELGNVMDVAMRGAETSLRRRFPDGRLQADPAVSSLRDQLQRLGVDPRKTPPCSELLLASFLTAHRIPRGSLTWEFLAILTAKSAAPWTVLDREDLAPPLVFRLGKPDEELGSLAGATACDALPVLADTEGVKASPWTHPVSSDLRDVNDAVFVCFLPEELFRVVQPKSHLGRVVWFTWAYRFVFERTSSFQNSL
jgi:DNA/RNA-binding domain of Phe-tRNA-synthetase-like protein